MAGLPGRTQLDVLDELDEIQVCVAYELDGQRVNHFPSSASELPVASRCLRPCRAGKPPRIAAAWMTCRRSDVLSALLGGSDGGAHRDRVTGASRDQTIVVEDPIHGPKRALLSA